MSRAALRGVALVPLLIATVLFASAASGTQRLNTALLESAGTASSTVRLPDPWDKADPPRRGAATYRLAFELETPTARHALYIPRGGNRLEVAVNREVLARRGDLAKADSDYSKLPIFVPIPASVLRTGGNEIVLRVAADAGRGGGLSEVWVGPEAEMRDMYEERMRWLAGGSLAVASMCAILGLLALGVAWRLRDRVYAIFGAASLLWTLRTLHVLVAEPPVPLAVWDSVIGTAYGWYVGLLCVFTLDVLEIRARWVRLGLTAYGIATPFVSVAAHAGGIPALWTNWLLLMTLVTTAVAIALVVQTIRKPRSSLVVLSLAGLIAIGTGLRDHFLFRRAADAYGSFSISRFVALGFMLALAWILIERFGAAMRAQANARREREQVLAEERARIMRDMHDGLGHQLVGALSMAERGELSSGDMAREMRECLDQLRLAIDQLDPVDDELSTLLGHLRFRLESRLARVGLAIDWDVEELPRPAAWTPTKAAHLRSIVLEAFTNVIKHAGARRVALRARHDRDARTISIEIADDGRGVQDRGGTGGRGLSSMRSRAEALGAQFMLAPATPGTRISLSLPLDA
jgi:signal transduction histidine kinase